MMNDFSLDGGVKLGCRLNSDGVPYLSSQRFSPPVHLSKPYFDEDTSSLLINLSCPTAGLLAGDRIICDIEVSDDASMVVTTPGATRAHFMRSGIARVEQKFTIKESSFLEFNPGALILQKATNLEQVTEIEVDEDGEVLFVEKMLPGRIAHGESFLFKRFSNQLKIRKENQLVLLEAFNLESDNESVLPWKNSFSTPYYGCFYLISKKLREHLPCRDRIQSMKSENLLTGSSSLHHKAGWMIKVLAGDPYEFKRAMKEIRNLLYKDIERKPTDFRRY
jgi:urease accessory protein